MRIWLLFLFISCFSFLTFAQRLKTDAGITLNFNHLKDTTLFVFYDLECPICAKYTKNLRGFKTDSAFKNIKIYLVLVGKEVDLQAVEAFKKEFEIETTFVFDKNKKLLKKLQATVTPEVFLMSPSREILYCGAIDNWYYDLGKNRSAPTVFFLKDALSEIQKKLKVTLPKTQAVGCALNRK